MAFYTTESDINDQLAIQQVPERLVLARFLSDFPEVENDCEYPGVDADGLATTLIDVPKAWAQYERLVLRRES